MPTRAELQEAYGRTIPDLVGPDLRVLLVGINPSLWSGWSGPHFGRPSNRLWPTLHRHHAALRAERATPAEVRLANVTAPPGRCPRPAAAADS